MFFNGSAQGIGLVCRLLRERGVRRLAVEDPGHADQCTDIQAAGLVTPRIPVDDRGLRVDRLERADADAVLVTPAHQFPTGAVLAPERRAALLEWTERRRAIVIEDDYDAEYRYDREPVGALQGLTPDRVVYVGSASKTLSPALRMAGWSRRASSSKGSRMQSSTPIVALPRQSSSRLENSFRPENSTVTFAGRGSSIASGATLSWRR
jgi:GntR family transcriptional regulator/MocR family aminotransferase